MDGLGSLGLWLEAVQATGGESLEGVAHGLNAAAQGGGDLGSAPGRFDAELFAARLDVCAGVDVSRPLRIRGCVGLGAGVIRAQGYGFPRSLVTVVPWLAIADDLELVARLDPRWSVEGAVSLILPLGQSSLVVKDFSGTALAERRLASFGGALAVGPVLRF